MIQKTIHYIWFGGNPLPPIAQKCINSWKEKCPDYEIIEWNEKNFDVNQNLYTKEAFESKKWAFISDYVRLYVLYHYGGIYMDTDVEVLENLDNFLVYKAFSGFESSNAIPTGIIGAEKGNEIIKELLDDYNDRHFILENGKMDLTTNVTTITRYFKQKGLVLNNTFQDYNGFIFFPSEYFCPKDYKSGEINLTKNTITIHHFNGSWIPKSQKIKYSILNKLDSRIVNLLVRLKRIIIK